MTTVEQHISNLLYTHECVIIPNFGAFVASSLSAHIDVDKNILTPPTKEIGFNRSLSHNDGLLISTLAMENAITYEEAKKEVDGFRLEIVDEIEDGKVFQIERLGTLKLDAIGNVIFTSSRSENFLTDSYGLGSFHFTPDVRITPVKEAVSVRRLLRPLTQKHIAATVALMVGLFAVSPHVNDEGVDTQFSASTIELGNLSISKNTHDYYVQSKELANSDSKEINIVEEAMVEEDHFFLIAGSFKREKQAEQFLKEIHALGQEQAFILESANKRYRIALDGYTNKPEAVNSLNSYRKLEDFKTVWVLKQ